MTPKLWFRPVKGITIVIYFILFTILVLNTEPNIMSASLLYWWYFVMTKKKKNTMLKN